MIKCPFCAGDIPDQVVKCKNCGEWLNQKKNEALSWRSMTQLERNIFILVCIVVAIIVIISNSIYDIKQQAQFNRNEYITNETERKNEALEEKTESIEAPPEPEPEEELTFPEIEKEIENKITNLLTEHGHGAKTKPSRFIEDEPELPRVDNIIIKAFSDQEDEKTITATLNGQSLIDPERTKYGMFKETELLFKELLGLEDINEVLIIWQLDILNDYGNWDTEKAMKISMDEEIYNKINWTNFSYINMEDVAKEYWDVWRIF